MKDIKELIYAAVEENAVAFQELAGGILQARAYDAIESLRPEIGASMFGESSHMKGKDDEDEEMEDEEDEDEEEMDDKKKSMKEALHVLVHKSFPDNVEKAHHAVSRAGGNWTPRQGMARMDKPGGQHDPTGGDHHVIHAPDHVTHAALKKNLSDYGARATIVDTHTGNHETVHEGFDQIDEEAKATVDALKKVHGDHNFHVDKKGEISHAYLKPSHVKKLVTALNTPGKGKGMIDKMMEEVDEAINVYMKDPAPEGEHIGTPIRYSKGHSAHGDQHRAMAAKAAKAARQQGHLRGNDNSHTGWKDSERITKERTGGVFAGYGPKPSNEEVEQVNERTREDLTSQIKGLKKPAIKHGFDWPTNDSTDNVSTGDLKRFHKSARSVIKQGLKDKDVQEVAMPQNQADMLAHILHQIKVTGHPVATDAQFRATTVGKDTTKKASLEPGQDKAQYAVAQGGNVKP